MNLKPIIAACIVLAAFALAAPRLGLAETAAELREKIAKEREEIEKLDEEIVAYQSELAEVGAKKQTLENTLQSLNLSIKQLGVKVRATKKKITAVQLEIRNIDRDIGSAEESIGTNKQAIGEVIRRLQTLGDVSMVEIVLREPSLSVVWEDIEAIAAFDRAVNERIEELKDTKVELSEDKDASEKKHAELARERENLASQEQSLAIAKREQQRLLSQTKSQESTYQDLIAEKRAARRAFESSLLDLESKLAFTLDPSKLPAAGKGVLRWPLDKVKITQYFGNTPFARSGAYNGKSHNGIDLRAAVGTPIRAASGGVVQATGNTDAIKGCYSYGKWALIEHANGLSTLYAHLSQFSVEQGESVESGDIIGFSGNTGYSTGPHLHFTVYVSSAVKLMRLGDATGRKTPCMNATIPVAPLAAYLNPLDYL